MLRIKYLLILMFVSSYALSQENFLHCSIDMNESSYNKRLRFGMDSYKLPEEYRNTSVSSYNNDRMEIINKMAEKGWGLESQNENILYFKRDLTQPAKVQEYWYGSLDIDDSSYNKKLKFGIDSYQIPEEHRNISVSSYNNDRMEIINKMAEKSWELPKEIQYGKLLYFKFSLINPEKTERYLHCSIDMNDSSYNKRLRFGMDSYKLPEEYRNPSVSSYNNDRMEIINKMAEKGWELPKEIQYGEKLYFRIRIN